jgi:hypothetical protein
VKLFVQFLCFTPFCALRCFVPCAVLCLMPFCAVFCFVLFCVFAVLSLCHFVLVLFRDCRFVCASITYLTTLSCALGNSAFIHNISVLSLKFSDHLIYPLLFPYYSGRTKYSAFVSKLCKLSAEYLCPQKTQTAAVFLFERSSAGE